MDSPFPDLARERLLEFYGGVIYQFSIIDAIAMGILCEYQYHLVPVFLNRDEQQLYDQLSADIGAIVAAIGVGASSKEQEQRLKYSG